MNSRYIIFADDDPDDLEMVTGFFREFNPGTTVLEFMDGNGVLNFLNRQELMPGSLLLIVLDINMPRLNGRETLLSIRQHPRYKNIPVVIYTTSMNETDEDFCHRNGASWVTKSNDVEGVRQVAKVLAEFCELQKH